MKIKWLITTLYIFAGFIITTVTSFLTYIIIGAPIGKPMVIKIVLTVLAMLPIIGLISYLLGKYLSDNFNLIHSRLYKITNEDYSINSSNSYIKEIEEINTMANKLSIRLNELVGGLKEKNSNLYTLLISMAHDIKTPLTIINGHIDEIKDGYVSKQNLPSTINQIKDEIQYLDELTIDMLSFVTSMQNGKSKSKIKLATLLDKEVLNIIPSKEGVVVENCININFEIEFNTVDLKKISFNLLSNAIKYTNNGYVKIYNDNENIYFENSGLPIDNKYKDKIFQPFFTISKSKNRKNRGFGLGLSIVSNLAKNNGYKCYLQESNSKKTIFVLSPNN